MNTISKLIAQYFTRRHDAETETKIQQWLISSEHSELKDEALHELFAQIKNKPDKAAYNSLKEVNAKLGIKSSRSWFLRHTLPRVAAVMLPLIVTTSVFSYQSTQIEMIEVVTMAGEHKELKLPDGSTVWINACSRINYPEKFNDTTRVIRLEGEAYFSIEKSKTKRFIVTTKEITVEVLGTQFNVKAYPNDLLVTTTLTSGKVTVVSPDEKYTLRPNQELVYNSIEKSATIQAVSSDAVGWKEGVLIFNDMTVTEILKGLERQYGVKFSYAQNLQSNDKYSIKFTNSETIQQVMSVLQDVIGNFIYTIDNKTITIQKSKLNE